MIGNLAAATMVSREVFKMERSLLSERDLSLALGYGLGTGSSQLLNFVTEHTEVWAL